MAMCSSSPLDLAGEHIDLDDPVDLVPEKLHPNRRIRFVGRNDLHHIAAHPERTPLEIHVIAVILNVDQLPQHLVPVFCMPGRRETIIFSKFSGSPRP